MGPILADLGGALLRAASEVLFLRGGRGILSAMERRVGAAIRLKIEAKIAVMARDVVEAIRDAEETTAEEALQFARYLSSGRISSRQLAMMGHPYRHGGNPPMDPAIINRQTGRFFQSWRVVKGEREGGISTRLENTVPYAPYLFHGTSRMIARPILQRIDEVTKGHRAANIRRAVVRGLTEAAKDAISL